MLRGSDDSIDRSRRRRPARRGLTAFAAAATALLTPAASRADPPPVDGSVQVGVRARVQVGGPSAQEGPRGDILRVPRPPFASYYWPFYPHEYWIFLYGGEVRSRGEPSPEPEQRSVGLGLFGGASADVEERDAAGELGLLGRLRLARQVQLEVELSRMRLDRPERVDRRAGAALVVHLLRRPVSPYLVGGGGFSRVDLDDGELAADRPYAEIGAGLELAIAHHLSLFGDVRAGLRKIDDISVAEQSGVARAAGPRDDDGGGFTRARIGALLYF
jgi:hypothetical protein